MKNEMENEKAFLKTSFINNSIREGDKSSCLFYLLFWCSPLHGEWYVRRRRVDTEGGVQALSGSSWDTVEGRSHCMQCT